jgi:hypothetical protein
MSINLLNKIKPIAQEVFTGSNWKSLAKVLNERGIRTDRGNQWTMQNLFNWSKRNHYDLLEPIDTDQIRLPTFDDKSIPGSDTSSIQSTTSDDTTNSLLDHTKYDSADNIQKPTKYDTVVSIREPTIDDKTDSTPKHTKYVPPVEHTNDILKPTMDANMNNIHKPTLNDKAGQNGLNLLTKDDFVVLKEIIEAYKIRRSIDDLEHTLTYEVRPQIKRGEKRMSVRLNEQLYQRAMAKLKAEKFRSGQNWNQLIEFLLWSYLEKPDDLVLK